MRARKPSQEPRNDHANCDEGSEYLHRRNRHQHERSEGDRGRQGCVRNRSEQLGVDSPESGSAILVARVQIEEFAKNVDAIKDSDRHKEDGDHGTHDVNREASADQ